MEFRLALLLLALTVVFDTKVVKSQDDEFPEVGQPCTTDNQVSGICRPPSQCPTAFDTIEVLANNSCPLKEGTTEEGICCPDLPIGVGECTRNETVVERMYP